MSSQQLRHGGGMHVSCARRSPSSASVARLCSCPAVYLLRAPAAHHGAVCCALPIVSQRVLHSQHLVHDIAAHELAVVRRVAPHLLGVLCRDVGRPGRVAVAPAGCTRCGHVQMRAGSGRRGGVDEKVPTMSAARTHTARRVAHAQRARLPATSLYASALIQLT